MNRAASFLCWAASVALVLSVPSAYAGTKVVQFPNKVRHTTLVSSDALNTVIQAPPEAVPVQTLSNRTGGTVVKFQPKANIKVPKSTFKANLKSVLKNNAASLALGLGIQAAVLAVGWVMSPDMTTAQKKTSDGTVQPVTYHGYKGDQTGCSGNFVSAEDFAACVQAYSNQVDGRWNETIKSITPFTNGSQTGIYVLMNHNLKNGTYNSTINHQLVRVGSCAAPLVLTASYVCVDPSTASFAVLTDSDLAALDPYVDGLSNAQLQSLYSDLWSVFPSMGTDFPHYLTSKLNGTSETLSTEPVITASARLNPDGSTTRLTNKNWTDFALNYHTGDTNIDYTTTNHNEVYNEAGEKVDDQVETDTQEEPAPALSPALATANDPLTAWAADVGNMNSKTVAGVSYPLLFTYGGTCSAPTLALPIIGSYSCGFHAIRTLSPR